MEDSGESNIENQIRCQKKKQKLNDDASRSPEKCSSSPLQTSSTLFGDFGFQIIKAVEELSSLFDAFILDQYGVLIDGKRALPGAVQCISKLVEKEKKLVILSNSPRRASAVLARLPNYGFRCESFLGAVTSGELCHAELERNWKGAKCTLITFADWTGHLDFFDGLDITFTTADQADLILCNGPDLLVSAVPCPPRGGGGGGGDGGGGGGGGGNAGVVPSDFKVSGDLRVYKSALEEAARRQLPMLCSNPDKKVNASKCTDDKQVFNFMPGSIAEHYEKLGGEVTYFGKPHKDAVEACLRLLVGAAGAPAPTEASSDGGKEAGEGGEGGGVRAEGEPTTPRTVVVGDSLHHDVLGARNAGLPSLLITAYGVHAEEIPAVSATLRPQQHNSETVTTLEGNESVPDNKAGPTYDTFLAASLTTSKIEGEENKTVDQIIAQQKQASKSTLVVPVADKAHETFEKHSIIPNYVACAFRWNCSS